MAADNFSQRVSRLSARLEELLAKCACNPEDAPEIMEEAMDGLKASLEELYAADEEIMQQNIMQQNKELMRAQSALQETEKQLRTTLESIGDGFFACDVEWRFVYVNAQAERILCIRREEVLGRSHWEVFPLTLGTNLEREYRLAAAGEVRNFENFYEPWGRWFHNRCFPREGGGMSVYFEDITERKHAEERLQKAKDDLEASAEELRLQNEELIRAQLAAQESEARLRRLYESGLIGVIYWNMDGVITDANDKFLEMVGYTRDDLEAGRIEWVNLTPPEHQHLDDLSIMELKATGVNKKPFEKEYIRKDGKRIPIIVAGAMLDETRFNGIAFALDITERKQAEEMLRTTLRRFYAVLSSMYAGILLVTDEGRVEFANQAFCDLFDLKSRPAELAGITSSGMIEKIKNAYLYPYEEVARIREIVDRGQPVKGEEIAMRDHRTCLRDFIPIYIDGKSYGRLWHHLDITERKLMEEELRKAHDELEVRVEERTSELQEAKENLEVVNEELQVEILEHEKTEKQLIVAKEEAEAAVEAKAAFLANMSHELRTPLNAVIGFSSLLLDDNITSEQKENIERIKNGGEALLSIISDILEFSRAEKEKINLELRPLSIKHCIEESLDMVAVQAMDKGLNLAYTISYGTPDIIIGDHGRLRQILVNLLFNAVKFTDIGDVSVYVSSKIIEGNKHRITFEVRDTGIGMPQDKMDRLFEPFTQLEYVISRKRDGAGLGLAISRKLVELMGGEIEVESVEGRGSTFRFAIPAETVQGNYMDVGEKDRDEYQNMSVQNPLSILVADDNPSNQRVLVEMLKRLGHRADAVADGAEVLQALQIRSYDLIFMDIKMQQMDGLTATRKIRKLWPDKGPTVVAITAYTMENDREMCLEAGMDDYIAKPVKINDITLILKKLASDTK